MHTTETKDTTEWPRAGERALRRAIEHVALSDRGAGARVAEAVRHRLAAGSQRIVITNAAREVTPERVEHAFEALRYSGLVCAPGAEGDIDLLGMTQPLDDLLSAIPWGTREALDLLLSTARSQHVSVMLLPPAAGERIGSSS